MNIFKTFEIFFSEPLSIIRNRVIQILHVETNIFAKKVPLSVDFSEKSAQITVYNNEKVYNLLRTVIQKRKQRERNGDKSRIYN